MKNSPALDRFRQQFQQKGSVTTYSQIEAFLLAELDRRDEELREMVEGKLKTDRVLFGDVATPINREVDKVYNQALTDILKSLERI